MTEFTTDALLYPLTKGDVDGHTFHGNQWQKVGGGESTPPRHPVGHYQLTPEETKAIAKQLVKDIKQYGTETAQDKASVAVSKLLGLDTPATRVDNIANPDLYRGCDPQGAKALTEPLTMYGNKGGTVFGNGVYTTPDPSVAEQYVNNGGVLVKMSLDPNAKLASDDDGEGDKRYLEYMKSLSENDNLTGKERDAMDDFALYSGNLALLTGYQGYAINTNKPSSILMFDRGAMRVQY